MATATTELTGAQRAAMLVMSLDEEQAANVLKHMSEASLSKLRQAAESLDVRRISDDEKRQTLRRFFVRHRQGGVFLGDADEHFRRVLAKAKGEDKVKELYAEPELPEEPADPIETTAAAYIESLPEEQIVSALERESARCTAVLLANLTGQKSGSVLNLLEEELRERIVERIITGETVPSPIVEVVLEGFRDKLEELTSGAEVASEEKRAQELAKMIGRLDREAQDRVLSQIGERDPEMAAMVERMMFAFEDLVKVAPRSMQELLRTVEVTHVALAMKGASEEMLETFTTNMSERVRERVEEEKEMAGRVPISQVEEAREEIMKVARRLYREGNLIVEIGDEQYVE